MTLSMLLDDAALASLISRLGGSSRERPASRVTAPTSSSSSPFTTTPAPASITTNTPAPEAVETPQSKHVTLEALMPGMCRWPEQTATDDLCSYRFCGQPVMATGTYESRGSYCPHHQMVAFQRAPNGWLPKVFMTRR